MKKRIYYECTSCGFTCHKDEDVGDIVVCPKCNKATLNKIKNPWTA